MTKTRRHSKRHSRSKNMINRTLKKGFHSVKATSKKGLNVVKGALPTVKATSKKYMPKVKTGLENVGSKVTKTATKSIPILQKASRDLLGIFGIKKKGKK